MRISRSLALSFLLAVAIMGGRGHAAELIYSPRSGSDASTAVVATVRGAAAVTMKDVDEGLARFYYETARSIHARELAWLRRFLEEHLIAFEAYRRKLSEEDLLRTEAKADPSDRSRWETARHEYARRLWDDAKMTISLPAPEPPQEGAAITYRPRTGAELSEHSVATAGGQTIVNRRDFTEGMSIPYYEAARAVHAQQAEWVERRVQELLLAREAERRRLSVDGLLKAEVKLDPSDRARWEAGRRHYLEALWRAASVTITLKEPGRPLVVASESTRGAVLGLEDAPISIVEFCAFTSSHCRDAWRVYREVVKHYGTRIRIAHRDAPDPASPAAVRAAVAGRCALRQGKFWPYHELLLESQDKLRDPAFLKALARQAGLNPGPFDQCLDRQETAREVEWDFREARRLSVSQLPSLFVNSTYVTGVLDKADLIKVLDSLALQ